MTRKPVKRERRYRTDRFPNGLNGEYWDIRPQREPTPPIIMGISRGTQTASGPNYKGLWRYASDEMRRLKAELNAMEAELDVLGVERDDMEKAYQRAKDSLDLVITPCDRWEQDCPDAWERAKKVWDEFE